LVQRGLHEAVADVAVAPAAVDRLVDPLAQRVAPVEQLLDAVVLHAEERDLEAVLRGPLRARLLQQVVDRLLDEPVERLGSRARAAGQIGLVVGLDATGRSAARGAQDEQGQRGEERLHRWTWTGGHGTR